MQVTILDYAITDWRDGIYSAFVQTDAPFQYGRVDIVGINPSDDFDQIFALTPVSAKMYGENLSRVYEVYGPRDTPQFPKALEGLHKSQYLEVKTRYRELLDGIGTPRYMFRGDGSMPAVLQLIDATGVAFFPNVHDADIDAKDYWSDYAHWDRTLRELPRG